MRGRGLKLGGFHLLDVGDEVAPHAGAWIETTTTATANSSPPSRPPPCGGVDRNEKVKSIADGLAYITSLSVFDFLMTCLDVFSLLEIM